jgi:hypothetical protein
MALKVILALLLSPIVIVAIATYYRKSKYPEKSLYNCFLNVALTPLRMLKIGPYNVGKITLEKAMKHAMRKTKLSDFGDTSFVNNYAVLTESPAHQKLKLTNLGFIMYDIEMTQTMGRRLAMLQYLKDAPEILKIPVRSPVFVLGLPRTGTTFLHRLLSLDPAVRAPLLWELLSPVPRSKPGSTKQEFVDDREKRASFIRKLIQTRQSFGDNALQHIHEIGADLPEECIMALTDELPLHMSYLYSAYLNYEKFFSDIDSDKVTAAYAHYKKVLQMLSFQVGESDTPRRWMLKCPIHLFYTKEIARVFPDAKIVW